MNKLILVRYNGLNIMVAGEWLQTLSETIRVRKERKELSTSIYSNKHEQKTTIDYQSNSELSHPAMMLAKYS